MAFRGHPATGGVFFYSASENFFPRSAPPPIKAALQSPLNPLFTTSPPAAAARPSPRFLRVLRFPHCFCGLSHFWFLLQDSTAWPASNGAPAAFEIFLTHPLSKIAVCLSSERQGAIHLRCVDPHNFGVRQTLKMEQEFSQNGTGPFWSTLWLRFGWIPGLSSSATPEGAAVTRIGAACGADNPRSSDVEADCQATTRWTHKST